MAVSLVAVVTDAESFSLASDVAALSLQLKRNNIREAARKQMLVLLGFIAFRLNVKNSFEAMFTKEAVIAVNAVRIAVAVVHVDSSAKGRIEK